MGIRSVQCSLSCNHVKLGSVWAHHLQLNPIIIKGCQSQTQPSSSNFGCDTKLKILVSSDYTNPKRPSRRLKPLLKVGFVKYQKTHLYRSRHYKYAKSFCCRNNVIIIKLHKSVTDRVSFD